MAHVAKKPALVRAVIQRLEQEYGVARHIPRFDPMEELVSCILSQHTSDRNSFPAFTRLMEKFEHWDAMAYADPASVAATIQSAGLSNQKTKSIQACLKEIQARTGDFNIDFLRAMDMMEARKWLESLPGVGPKTASIVLCFSFGMGAIPIDTHVFRVSWRLGLFKESIGEQRAHDVILNIVPADLAFRFHAALIQHGRYVCKAPRPDCERCSISDLCDWFKKGGFERQRKVKARAKSHPKSSPPKKSHSETKQAP